MIHIRYFTIIALLLKLSFNGYGQQHNPTKSTFEIPTAPEEILILDTTINLYKAGDFYISGQPDDVHFNYLKEQNIGLVINVRTPEEIKQLKENGFDEEAFLDSLFIPYVNIPMGGEYGFSPGTIEKINKAITLHDDNILIHCRRAGRATNAWMAWLINYGGMPVNKAISLGRKMQFSLYLEDLLGYELSFSKPK